MSFDTSSVIFFWGGGCGGWGGWTNSVLLAPREKILDLAFFFLACYHGRTVLCQLLNPK